MFTGKLSEAKTLARQQTKLGHSSPSCANTGSVPLQCYGAVLYWVKQSSRVQSVRSPLVLTANRSVCFRGEPSANRHSTWEINSTEGKKAGLGVRVLMLDGRVFNSNQRWKLVIFMSNRPDWISTLKCGIAAGEETKILDWSNHTN